MDPMTAQAAGGYGTLDIAVLVLREGFEALLVVLALLGLAARSPAGERRRQETAVAAGVGGGLLLALLLAWAVRRWLAAEAAAAGRELVSGLAGLAAVVLMLGVGSWLHERSTAAGWNRYLKQQMESAAARGSLLRLALVAGTAVLREGVEVVAFFAGLAASVAAGQAALGLVLALLLLAAAGFAALRFGWRLPAQRVFLVASLLLDVLAFKFAGAGIHALQEAGLVPESAGPLPGFAPLGLYPTWQSSLAQLVVLLAVTAFWLEARRRDRAALGAS